VKKLQFQVKFHGQTLRGDVWGEGVPQVLLLHGAGKGDRTRFVELREMFLRDGLTSIAFDFIGHGETGGDLKSSSLKDRTEQALAVLKHFDLHELKYLIGCSMSGYTAVKLSEYIRLEKMVLIVPAMYRSDVYDEKFNEGFTELIRKKNSWEKSDAWKILSEFKDEILIIKAGQDQTIPQGVAQKLFNSAKQASHRDLVTIEQAPHKIMLYCREFPHLFGKIYSEIREDTYDRSF